MRSRAIFFGLIAAAFLLLILRIYSIHRPVESDVSRQAIRQRVDQLLAELQLELQANNKLLQQLIKEKDELQLNVPGHPRVSRAHGGALVAEASIDKSKGGASSSPAVIPVLVMACDRTTVQQSIDDLLRYRPSAERFPIIVSQDCGHAETEKVVLSYGSKVQLIKQPDLTNVDLPPKDLKFMGYYKISRHYKWALNQVFRTMSYDAVIIVEDDLNIAPDFFEYFTATYPLLKADSSLWCISAWNDNGKPGLIADDSELLHRTDFFPGLGWLLEKEKWLVLEPKWPAGFWDDWMRLPEQREGRSCIRPEISRTKTFGKVGVSKGEFFDKHLRFIQLNQNPVKFTSLDLSYLTKLQYDSSFVKKVYGTPVVSIGQIMEGELNSNTREVRVQYSSAESFKVIAKQLAIMEDFKAGVPRTAYRGVVSVMHNGVRVYVAPPPDWQAYDPSWT